MNPRYLNKSGPVFLVLLAISCMIFAFGCDGNNSGQSDQVSSIDSAKAVVITGNGVKQAGRMTLQDMMDLPDARTEHIYSIINNWPSRKKFAARGIKVRAVLNAAGIRDEAQGITFKGEDGYECSFTRAQLLETPRYYFPGIMEGDPAGAEPVEPIIAYQYKENSDNLSEARADSLCLIIPQANINEQTNHTFVKGISEIRVTVDDPGKWETAGVFPAPGRIASGDTVKLQHKDLGKVKIYYTLDGSIPTENSTLYNPSTYQPELNKPIIIRQDTTIKVLVRGYGKYDSDIAEFHYQIK